MPLDSEAAARAAASSIVDVTGDSVRLLTDELGNARLPMVPVRHVSTVTFDTGETIPVASLVVDANLIQGLPYLSWATFVYDHGWNEPDVPQVVRTIVDNLTRRMLTVPDDTVQSEVIGHYRVHYELGARWLTDDEKRALGRHHRAWVGATASVGVGPEQPRDTTTPFPFGMGWE